MDSVYESVEYIYIPCQVGRAPTSKSRLYVTEDRLTSQIARVWPGLPV